MAAFAGLLLDVAVGQAGAGDAFNPYVVSDIEVSATAENAVIAKEEALDEALETAARRVFRRITANGDPPDIMAEQAEKLLLSYENGGERVGSTGYSARYRVEFSPMLVRGFLARRGLAVVDQPSPTILLVPVIVRDGTELWWDEAADWAEALAAQDMEERLVPVRIPANSLEDTTARRDRLISGDYVTLGEFRVRYRAHSAVIARVDTESDGEGMLVSATGEDAAGRVDVTVEVPAGGFPKAAGAVAEILAERWKSVAMGQGTAGLTMGHSLPVRALLGGNETWTTLRDRLERSGAVNGLSVEAMTSSEAHIVIWFSGPLDDLPSRLARDGVDLFEAGGAWLLQTY